MNELPIEIEEQDTKGRAFLKINGELKAEMTYSKAGEELIIIDHTEVDDSLRGQGVGRKLLNQVVAMVREQNKKVIPLCPFAKSVFDKDETIRDVLRS